MLNKEFLTAFQTDGRYHSTYIEERDINDIHLGVNIKKVFKLIISGYTARKPIPKMLATIYIFNDNSMSLQVGSFIMPITLDNLSDSLNDEQIELIKSAL